MECKIAESMVNRFVNGTLDEEEMERFIIHVKNCESCYEELEIYFTIKVALRQLDANVPSSFNIKKMLKDELTASEQRIRRRRVLVMFQNFLKTVASFILLVTLAVQIFTWIGGGYPRFLELFGII